MKRREALRSMAIFMGTAISASTLSVILDSCNSEQNPVGKTVNLSQSQKDLLAELTEIIVPKTADSGGAKEAEVGPFIPMMLSDCYPAEKSDLYLKGLETFEKTVKEKYGKDFASLNPEQQMEATKALREVTLANKEKDEKSRDPQAYFFTTTRDLTLLGYYSSEVGYTKALGYYENDIPGKYNGNVALKPGQKRWG